MKRGNEENSTDHGHVWYIFSNSEISTFERQHLYSTNMCSFKIWSSNALKFNYSKFRLINLFMWSECCELQIIQGFPIIWKIMCKRNQMKKSKVKPFSGSKTWSCWKSYFEVISTLINFFSIYKSEMKYKHEKYIILSSKNKNNLIITIYVQEKMRWNWQTGRNKKWQLSLTFLRF